MAQQNKKNADLVTELYDRLRAADSYRAANVIDQIDTNKKRFLGEHYESTSIEGLTYATANLTQNSTLAHAAIQTERRPTIRFGPRESSERAYWRLRPEAGFALNEIFAQEISEIQRQAVAGAGGDPGNTALVDRPEGLTDAMLSGDEPITQRNLVTQIRVFMQDWSDRLGQIHQAALEPDDLIEVNDALAAEILQVIHDVMWDRSNSDAWLVDMMTNTNIFGTQPALYQWRYKRHQDEVKNLHIKNVWISPQATNVEDADFVIIVQIMSKDEAKSRWPKFAKKIDSFVPNEGTPFSGLNSASDVTVTFGEPYRNTGQFGRPMIARWTMWLRYGTEYKITEQEAEDLGKVVRVPGQEIPIINEETGQVDEFEQEDDGFVLAVEDTETGELMPTEATDPSMDNWPTLEHPRQVMVLADEVVQDVQCPYSDIPVLWSKGIPEPYRPYGKGEPERLEHVQQLINQVLSIFIDHLRVFRSQQQIFPSSVWEAIKKKRFWTHPNRVISLADRIYDKYIADRASGTFSEPTPPFPSEQLQLLRELINLHNSLSGNTDILQGRAPGSDTSGVAINSLTGAARGVIGFKSRSAEQMLTCMTRIRVAAIRDFLPKHQWRRYITKYPPAVIEDVVGRTAMKQLDFDITVEISAGAGITRTEDQDRALQLRQLGAISQRTLLERVQINDVDTEIERLAKETAELMRQQAQAAAQQQQEQGSAQGQTSQ